MKTQHLGKIILLSLVTAVITTSCGVSQVNSSSATKNQIENNISIINSRKEEIKVNNFVLFNNNSFARVTKILPDGSLELRVAPSLEMGVFSNVINFVKDISGGAVCFIGYITGNKDAIIGMSGLYSNSSYPEYMKFETNIIASAEDVSPSIDEYTNSDNVVFKRYPNDTGKCSEGFIKEIFANGLAITSQRSYFAMQTSYYLVDLNLVSDEIITEE